MMTSNMACPIACILPSSKTASSGPLVVVTGGNITSMICGRYAVRHNLFKYGINPSLNSNGFPMEELKSIQKSFHLVLRFWSVTLSGSNTCLAASNLDFQSSAASEGDG